MNYYIITFTIVFCFAGGYKTFFLQHDMQPTFVYFQL